MRLLKKDKKFVSKGELLKKKDNELGLKIADGLIKLFLVDKTMKPLFFAGIDKTLIFDKDNFIRFVSNKAFCLIRILPLRIRLDLRLETILSPRKKMLLFPCLIYNDCILEG